jgi:hypothetical protein
MTTQVIQQNGIHLNVRATVGGTAAGQAWIPVPADGVPAEILPHVRTHLGERDGRPVSSGGFCVDAPTWESVLAEVARDVAAEAKRTADAIAERERNTEDWRKRAAVYMAGGEDANNSLLAYTYEASREEVRAVQAERDRRTERAMVAKTAEVESVIERLAGGEGTLDTPAVSWLEIGGKRISWSRNGGISADLQARIDQVSRQRAEQAKRDEAAAKRLAIAERNAWIVAYGSDRLKKGLATGMIDKMGSVYLDERIAHDLGKDWSNWQAAPEPKHNDRLNPDESELDALAEARAKWPDCDARLRSVGGNSDEDDEERPWRPALLMTCPWDKDEEAIRYLD